MNKKSIIATVVVVIFVQIYEFIVHVGALSGVYDSLASVWRPEESMESYMPWMMLGQVLFAIMFVVVYCCSRCKDGVKQGALFGLYVGLLMSSASFVFYAVLPITINLMFAWIVTGIIETVLMGIILAVLMKKDHA